MMISPKITRIKLSAEMITSNGFSKENSASSLHEVSPPTNIDEINLEEMFKININLHEREFKDLKNIYRSSPMITLMPYTERPIKQYIKQVDSLANLLKSNILNLDFELNSEFIKRASNFIINNEEVDFKLIFEERMAMTAGEKSLAETDSELIGKSLDGPMMDSYPSTLHIYCVFWRAFQNNLIFFSFYEKFKEEYKLN